MNAYYTVQLAKTISAAANDKPITEELKCELIQKEALDLILNGAEAWSVFEFAVRYGTLTGYRLA